MSLPTISFEGNLTDDPELRFTGKGLAICSLRIAASDRVKNEETGKWVNGDATYLRVYTYREMAENCAESLSKGDTVVVIGKFKTRSYEDKNGDKKFSHEIEAESIGLSLRWESFHKQQEKNPKQKKEVDDPWATAPF